MAKFEEKKFYRCKHCGNIIQMVYSAGVPVICCGEPMSELIANTVDASKEKHVPVITLHDDKIKIEVGSVVHPMTEEHYIQWIYLETDSGAQRKELLPGNAPVAEFALNGSKPLAAYAYCNLHGLWKSTIK